MIAAEILQLAELANADPRSFRHVIVSASVTASTGISTLLTYTVPTHSTFVITNIRLRSIPTPNDTSLTVGDWRSEDVDASGLSTVWIEVGGVPFTKPSLTYLALTNLPILITIPSSQFSLKVNRASPPTSLKLLVAVSGYLCPSNLYDNLAEISTTFG
jgi:hypothetical protein